MAEGRDSTEIYSDHADAQYKRVEEPSSQINVEPTTVNVNTTNIYADKYKVYNINNANNVQINNNAEATPNTQLSFNSLHGNDVVLECDNTKVVRRKGYKNGICFVNRPFSESVPVHFRIKDTFEGTFGRCRMGFTNRNPSSLEGSGILQKGAESVKSSDGFVVIEPSMDTCSYQGAVIYFSYSNDQVIFRASSYENETSQIFPCPNTFCDSDDLWAFIELRGAVKAVEVENNDFHEVCGSLVNVQGNKAFQGLCFRAFGSQGGMICFTKSSVPKESAIEFKLIQVELNSVGHLRVGISKESPDLFRPENLPQTIVRDSNFVTVEIAPEDAVSDTIISLIPIGSQVSVTVNHNRTFGTINLDKPIGKAWPIVELFGKTKAVEIVPDTPDTDTIATVSDKRVEVDRDPHIHQQIIEIANLWLESQVLMNKLKVLADAVMEQVEGVTPSAYWNSIMRSVETAAVILGVDTYFQMAEIGDTLEIIRTEGPHIADCVRLFVSHIDGVKASVGRIDVVTIPPGQTLQFKLLRSIAAGLPMFDIRMPGRKPSTPPPAPLLLNLSVLPREEDNTVQEWCKIGVARTLLDTANKIESSFSSIGPLIRNLYAFGI